MESVRFLAAAGCIAVIAILSSCKSNNLSAVAGSCPVGFVDCNHDPSDGCEVDTTEDPKNCGGCGVACSAVNGVPSCANSACSIACTVGFADCNKNVTDGCEVVTNTDTGNCGACGARCDTENASETCAGGRCTVSHCAPPFADCDGDPTNGCETDTSSTVSHCGSCSNVCGAVDSGTASCTASACSLACASGRVQCAGNCVDPTSDSSNCGSCGVSCGGSSCTNAQCNVTMATSLYFPERIAAGASFVFFSDKHNSTIYVLPLSAQGGVPTSFVSGLSSVDALAALGHELFYEVGPDLYSINDDGTNTQHVAAGIATGLWSIDNGRIYYVTETSPSTATAQSTLVTANLDGSGAFPLGPAAAGTGDALGAGGCSMYWQVATPAATGSTIIAVPLTGGLSLNISTPKSSGLSAAFSGLAADAQYVYYNDVSGGTTSWNRVLRSGGAVQDMASGSGFQKLLTDGTSDYVLTGIAGTAPSGTPALSLQQFAVGSTTLTSLYAGAADFDVQDNYLYVADPNSGAIVRIAKAGPPGGGTSMTSTCACNPGYVGDGKICRTCGSNNGGCDPNATCVQDGVVSCACNTGYSGPGNVCTSECGSNNGGCDPNAICTLDAGVSCACNTGAGYEGNGQTCSYNPCLLDNGGCYGGPSVATCTNNSGTASCTCNAPYAPYTTDYCYLDEPGTYSTTVTMYLDSCNPNVGAVPSLTIPSSWVVSESGPPGSNASVAWSWSGCSSFTLGGTPTAELDIELDSAAVACHFVDQDGDDFVVTSASGGHATNTTVSIEGGAGSLTYTPHGGSATSCGYQISGLI